jgi:adenosylhomocysteine nucleosidase
MPEEIRVVRARLRNRRRITARGLQAWSGEIANIPTTVALTGEGARNARRGADALLSATPTPGLLVVLGMAGALDPQLRPTDLVIGARVLRDHQAPLQIGEGLLASVENELGAVTGWVATVDRIVSSAQEKKALRHHCTRWLPKDTSGPGLVDLESRFFVEPAEQMGVPWIVLRTVSDTAWEELPAFLEHARDETGAIARRRVLLHAAGRPGRWADLVRLGSRSWRCSRVLAQALDRLLVTARGQW